MLVPEFEHPTGALPLGGKALIGVTESVQLTALESVQSSVSVPPVKGRVGSFGANESIEGLLGGGSTVTVVWAVAGVVPLAPSTVSVNVHTTGLDELLTGKSPIAKWFVPEFEHSRSPSVPFGGNTVGLPEIAQLTAFEIVQLNVSCPPCELISELFG
jgi:hypothetical protein